MNEQWKKEIERGFTISQKDLMEAWKRARRIWLIRTVPICLAFSTVYCFLSSFLLPMLEPLIDYKGLILLHGTIILFIILYLYPRK